MLTCEICSRTIELVAGESPHYRKAIDAGWRLEYHAPDSEGEPPRVSAKCDVCRTRNIRRPDFSERTDERAS